MIYLRPMNYIVKGTLHAINWGDCKESLPNVMVKLYDVQGKPNLEDLLLEKEKNILVVDSSEILADKKKSFLGETLTDNNGSFELLLSDLEYQGRTFEVAIYCETLPGLKKAAGKPLEFVIATIQPKWDKVNNMMVFEWNYSLPFGFWRYILSLFDVWVIYGKIISSTKHRKPIIGVEVIAKDADWVSENELGFSITDNDGYFKIYYTSREFMKYGVSLGKSEEVLSSAIYSGPDVYFTVKTVGGIALIDEMKNVGRKPERSNIGNCYCVTLTVIEDQREEIIGTDSTWTGIGETVTIPVGDDMNSF